MSNTPTVTTPEHPERYTLQMALCPDRIDYSLHIAGQEGSLQWGSLPVVAGTAGYRKAVENVVYDNPALLADYAQVRVLVASERFALLPQEVAADPDTAEAVMQLQFPDAQGDIALDPLPACHAALACEVPEGVLAFLQRTWNMPPVHHLLHPLCEYYVEHSAKRGEPCLYAQLHERSADVVAFNAGKLLLACSYPAATPDEAAYFVLHAWHSCNLDPDRHQLLLIGSKALRDQVAPRLRQYVACVMPAIFPAQAVALAPDATKAPHSLILQALCE